MTLQKQQMDLLKEQNESNKQFFANMIKGQQEIIEREEREKDREFFFNLIWVNFLRVRGFFLDKITPLSPCLKLVRIKLETSYLARK